MYGQAFPCLVYGFNLNASSIKLDEDWIASKYPLIQCYASDIVRNYLGEPVYGVQCEFDTYTGVIVPPNEEETQMIKELYEKYLEYYEQRFGQGGDRVNLGYHVALLGWDEEDHDVIVLDDDKDFDDDI